MGHLNDKKSDLDTFTPGAWLRTGDKFVANDQGIFFRDADSCCGQKTDSLGASRRCRLCCRRASEASDDFVPRAWLVLSNSDKSKSIDRAQKEIERFGRIRLNERQWLHGGFEVVSFWFIFARAAGLTSLIDTLIAEWEIFAPSATISYSTIYTCRERKKTREHAKL